jgi:hypothetical protein
MSPIDDHATRVRLIARARHSLNTEYDHKYRAEYAAWIERQKNAWKENHTVVPYVPFFVSDSVGQFRPTIKSPTEEEVVARALELYNLTFAANPTTPPPAPAEPAPLAETVPVPEPAVIEGTPVAVDTVPVAVPTPEPQLETIAVEPAPAVEPAADPIPIAPAVANILEIFKDIDLVPTALPADPVPPAPETPAPQEPVPAKVLAQSEKLTGRLLPSVLQKIDDLKMSWASKPTNGGNK